jgi:hypothetical protein
VAHRKLLPVYVRQPGKSRRYLNTETGETISYNAFRKLASQWSKNFAQKRAQFEADLVSANGDINRVMSDKKYSKRFIVTFKRTTPADRNPFEKEKGKWITTRPKVWWHTYINSDLKVETAPFYGDNLHFMQAYRRAVAALDQRTLNELAMRHRQGIMDANGMTRHPEFNLKKIRDVERKMTKAERTAFKKAEYYSDKQAEAA